MTDLLIVEHRCSAFIIYGSIGYEFNPQQEIRKLERDKFAVMQGKAWVAHTSFHVGWYGSGWPSSEGNVEGFPLHWVNPSLVELGVRARSVLGDFLLVLGGLIQMGWGGGEPFWMMTSRLIKNRLLNSSEWFGL